MKGSKALVLAVVAVAAVVGLEEWRIDGWRGRVGRLEEDLAAAQAAIPPPPRPEPPGESPAEVLRRTKARQLSERVREAEVSEFVSEGGDDVDPAAAGGTPAGEPEPAFPPPPVADERTRATVLNVYGELIRRFQLEGEDAEYFINLLGEGIASRQRLALDLLDAKSDAERAGIQRHTEEVAVQFAERVRNFLGNDDDFAVYRDYVSRLAAQGTGS